jgi:pyruvate dehydrogenase E2 component (dihydrolipoamide acetyltransferase)
MAVEVKMPRLSLTMESGVVLHWLKAVGDAITKGEDLAEVETDKVNVVMEAPASGYLRGLLVETGVAVPCDTTIALLTATADEPLAAHQGTALASAEPNPTVFGVADANRPQSESPDAEPVAVGQAGGRAHVNASPAAKNLAKQLGVDIITVVGSGPGGRVGLEDVERAAAERTPLGAGESSGAQSEERLPLSKMRAAIAQQMSAAAAIPQFSARRRVDMTQALRWRAARSSAGVRQDGDARAPGVIDVLHLAVARALLAHPEVNAAFFTGDSQLGQYTVRQRAVNLGTAVALPDGLVVPVIHGAHSMALEALAAARARLQEQAREGRLSSQSLSGATFTVSNLGGMGVDEFAAIVNPPQVAILAVGKLQDDVVVRDGAIHILPMITLTVTADHRALDGADIARFLETLVGYLEKPEVLANGA